VPLGRIVIIGVLGGFALGHFETKTFDAKTGNILTLKGPNGLSTTWQYDFRRNGFRG
jgi:hypothetical protein